MFTLEKISFQFSGSIVEPLRDVSVHIPTGAMVAIMGLNGAGKTTLLKVMSGFLKQSSGSLLIDSRAPSKFSHKALAQRLTVVPQDFPTEFPFTVFDFVMMGRFAWQQGLFHTQDDQDKVVAVLKRLNLEKLATRIISTLSGGERQRLLIARALVQETKSILLDEPVNHLDIKNKIQILNLLKQENQDHQKTIVAVMHDFHDVQKYFDQVLLLKDGQLKFYGDISQGFQDERLQSVFDVDVKKAIVFSDLRQ